jgi:dTDP-4-dehydrorhamnose reductase
VQERRRDFQHPGAVSLQTRDVSLARFYCDVVWDTVCARMGYSGSGWRSRFGTPKGTDLDSVIQSKALVVGASGQVGTQMLRALGERALATSRMPRAGWLQMDLAGLTDVAQAASLLDAAPVDTVFCVGGMTHVDGCEAEPELAWQTNARGPGVLAEYARGRGLPFVFFSTEYVFDGAATSPGPYAEYAQTNPLSVYGKSKLEGEQRVLAAYAEALVLRTTVVYGPDPREMNYLYALMRNLSAGTRMRVPEDQISTPTYNRDLIEAALGLVRAKASGVFHAAGPERMGRLTFAQSVARRLGLDEQLLEGVPTSTLGQAAARPLDAGLATEKLKRLHPTLRMRTLAESLEDSAGELNGFLRGRIAAN